MLSECTGHSHHTATQPPAPQQDVPGRQNKMQQWWYETALCRKGGKVLQELKLDWNQNIL